MNNPPAFPTGTGVTPYNPGMTLRDYMAAKAMQAFLMKPSSITCPDEIIAQDAYNTADAMLAAREQK
jgi:hypothetical protein